MLEEHVKECETKQAQGSSWVMVGKHPDTLTQSNVIVLMLIIPILQHLKRSSGMFATDRITKQPLSQRNESLCGISGTERNVLYPCCFQLLTGPHTDLYQICLKHEAYGNSPNSLLKKLIW